METTPIEPLNAVSYHRVHAGKLMIIRREEGHPLRAADFFHLDSVGTHPTGLFVTGAFDNAPRRHLKAESVRLASASEIAWRDSSRAIETTES